MKLSAVCTVLLVACSGRNNGAEDAGPNIDASDTGPGSFRQTDVKQILGAPNRDVDILVVVDNSGGMYNEQVELVNSFNLVLDGFANINGGLPNIHLGVVSTNLGAGPYEITGCLNQGDNGVLQNAAVGSEGCSAPTDRYISDIETPQGTRETNFQGTLAESFSCIAQLGATGCGFEQPLQSMRQALNDTNPLNAGFLREDAMLAVLVLSDEDDCSVRDPAMFNTDSSLDNIDSSLGFLSSHRCFEFGVVCDPDTPRELGAKQNCVSRNDSQYMYGVDEYADFLQGLKPSGGMVFYSAIAGVAESSITVVERGDTPQLAPGCMSGSEDAIAGIRIAELGERMGMPPISSICNEVRPSVARFAIQLSSMMSGRCLVGNPNVSECRFADVENFGQANEEIIQELLPCDMVAEGACFVASQDCLAGTATEITVDRRGTEVPSNTVAVAACPPQ